MPGARSPNQTSIIRIIRDPGAGLVGVFVASGSELRREAEKREERSRAIERIEGFFLFGRREPLDSHSTGDWRVRWEGQPSRWGYRLCAAPSGAGCTSSLVTGRFSKSRTIQNTPCGAT